MMAIIRNIGFKCFEWITTVAKPADHEGNARQQY